MSKPAVPAVRTGQAELDNALLAIKQTLDGITGQARNITPLPPLPASASLAAVVQRLNEVVARMQ